MQGTILLGGILPFEHEQPAGELASRLSRRPDLVVWVTPPGENHGMGVLAAPQIAVGGDQAVRTGLSPLQLLVQLCQQHGFPLVVRDRYGAVPPDPAMQRAHADVTRAGCGDLPWLVLSACGMSAQDHYYFGQIVREAIRLSGLNAVVLAAGSPSPEQLALAQDKIGRLIREAQPREFPWMVLLGLHKAVPFSVQAPAEGQGAYFVSQTPAETAAEGPVVGADTLPELAFKALEAHLASGLWPQVDAESMARFGERKGLFVNLFLRGQWRGGMGNLHAGENLAQATVRFAVATASQDPRFQPLTASDLADLRVQVMVLGEPQAIHDMAMIDPQTYGLYLTTGYQFGLVLPKVAGVRTPNEQIAAAMQKAGIQAGEPMWMYRFTVDELGAPATVPSSS